MDPRNGMTKETKPKMGAELFRFFGGGELLFFLFVGGSVVVGGSGAGKTSAEIHVRTGRTQKLL